MAILGSRPKFQAFEPGTTSPLAGGKLFTYVAGTTTKKNTYTTAAEAVTNTNPIFLDSNGECDLWYGTGSYKVVLAPADDTDPPTNAIWTVDNFNPSSDTLAGIISANSITGAVNYFEARNAATGNAPRLTATGDGTDTNISLELETTGTGTINLLAPTNITGDTAVTGTLTSSGALTISSGGANITGATTSSGALTVSAGGAAITGDLVVTGALSATSNGTIVDYLRVSGNASNAGRIRLYEDTDNGTNYTEIRGAASQTTDKAVVLPTTWTDGQYLQCSVSGDTITLQTSAPATTANIPKFVLHGFETSRSSGDTDHDISISAGFCLAADNSSILNMASALIKQIDAVWAEGTNAGGRASALSLTNNTWYHIFLIIKNDGSTVDAGFDTSLTAANLLSDAASYVSYRRIGSVLTDGSANIISYYQRGDTFYWAANVTDYSSLAATTQYLPLTIPQDITVNALCQLYLQGDNAAGVNTAYLAHTINSGGSSLGISTAGIAVSRNAGTFETYQRLPCTPLAELGEVYLVVSGTSPNVDVITNGWVDNRGKDGRA